MKARKYVLYGLLGLVLGLIVLRVIADFLVEFWWFSSLNFDQVFWKVFEWRYGLWLFGFLFASGFLFVNLHRALHAKREFMLDPRIDSFMEGIAKPVATLATIGVFIIGVIMAGILSPNWMELLALFNAETFPVSDPIFGNNVGFYVFTLPFINTFTGWLLGLLIVALIGIIIMYALRQSVTIVQGKLMMSVRFRSHALALFSSILILLGIRTWLGRYDILLSTRSGSLFGAGYTDVYADLPATWIIAIMFVVSGILMYWFLMRGRVRQAALTLATLVVVAIAGKAVYPAIIQNFIVNPTEQEKELQFINNNIAMTRAAYELNNIAEKSINPQYSLTREDIVKDSATINNIMLWDYRPLASTLDQLQVIRLYYDFPDVDIDRYTLPNGDYRQVMLGARELNQEKLPPNARTWVNQRLQYTHGYGIGMSPVNVVTDEGLPEFFIKDIPPVSSVDLKIERPEVYFGEQTDMPVIVKAGLQEFDFPMGDQNTFSTYKTNSGVPIRSILTRLLMAVEFGDINMLISGYLTNESRILYHRNINERVRKLAPFLTYDRDPYIVLSEGRLMWIYDAYTTTGRYPYSKPHESDINYIRNSVKVVIDAYTGMTTFYLTNTKDDPMIRMYARIFPSLFKDIKDMPKSLFDHVRYPQDLFDIQASMYSVYHMNDAKVFYNKEDVWNIANEKMQDHVQPMESYWAIMRLPGEEKEEFIQLLPYTPNKRDNMVAWLCARSDGLHYGKLLVYKFPKQDLTYGPMQVAARIDQDPLISQQLTLWNQQGSSVTRGNLLVIPIKEEVIYIQPIYLQATTGKLPELKRVIVSFGNHIAMEPTLDAALASVFGGRPEVKSEEKAATEETREQPRVESVVVLSRMAQDHYNKSQKFLKEGNWAGYGEEQKQMKLVLERLVKAAGK
jgi:uncharacterized membrane protein (UPF0182 family)